MGLLLQLSHTVAKHGATPVLLTIPPVPKAEGGLDKRQTEAESKEENSLVRRLLANSTPANALSERRENTNMMLMQQAAAAGVRVLDVASYFDINCSAPCEQDEAAEEKTESESGVEPGHEEKHEDNCDSGKTDETARDGVQKSLETRKGWWDKDGVHFSNEAREYDGAHEHDDYHTALLGGVGGAWEGKGC